MAGFPDPFCNLWKSIAKTVLITALGLCNLKYWVLRSSGMGLLQLQWAGAHVRSNLQLIHYLAKVGMPLASLMVAASEGAREVWRA